MVSERFARKFDRWCILNATETDLTEFGYCFMRSMYLDIVSRHPELEQKTDNTTAEDRDGSLSDLQEV